MKRSSSEISQMKEISEKVKITEIRIRTTVNEDNILRSLMFKIIGNKSIITGDIKNQHTVPFIKSINNKYTKDIPLENLKEFMKININFHLISGDHNNKN